MADINISGERRSITVNLVGEEYQAYPPKPLVMAEFSRQAEKTGASVNEQIAQFEKTVAALFDKKDAAKVLKRLGDPQDALDVDHIMKLMQALTEYADKDRPTTSRTA